MIAIPWRRLRLAALCAGAAACLGSCFTTLVGEACAGPSTSGCRDEQRCGIPELGSDCKEQVLVALALDALTLPIQVAQHDELEAAQLAALRHADDPIDDVVQWSGGWIESDAELEDDRLRLASSCLRDPMSARAQRP